ncbi:hypothetical protein PR202_gb11210 [Eleusine coracana subsp. coracana]|uniref:Piwi domain-containing protein n=1 Tax=Eleusine coracana subsp. coracana TaxID=191504 RepID=A0AAV5EMD1_ELECO|nr:hypothetical protein PR202_gb11210 [Eleusine coracana subsp. coracana]
MAAVQARGSSSYRGAGGELVDFDCGDTREGIELGFSRHPRLFPLQKVTVFRSAPPPSPSISSQSRPSPMANRGGGQGGRGHQRGLQGRGTGGCGWPSVRPPPASTPPPVPVQYQAAYGHALPGAPPASQPPPSPSPAPAAGTRQGANEPAPAKEVKKKLFVSQTAVAVAAQEGTAVVAEDAPDVELAHPAFTCVGIFGKNVMIRANNFLVDVADNNLFLYDVSINPELKTSQTKEKVLNGVIKLHGQTSLGGKLPAYDGRKTLYTSSSLPFVSEELVVMLIDLEKKQRAEREYMITTDTYHLTQFMSGRQMTIPQETNQWLISAILQVCKIVEGHRYSENLRDKQAVNPHPCVEVKSASPNCIENALRDVQRRATQILGKQGPGTQIPLLIIILPDTSCFHGKIKRVCETDIGMVSYCCLPRHVSRPNSQYLENVALKINVKVGGHNTFLGRSESPKDVIPLVSGKKESPRDVVPTQPYWNQVTEHDLIRDIVTDGQFENVLQVNAIREVIYEVWVDAKVAFIQRDKPATLEHIVHEAMIILNCHPRDIYFCREGRPVPSDKLLVQSCKLVSQFRLRGGFRNDPIPLAVFIDSIKHADVSKWFENITIPFNLRRKHGPKYEIGLGEDASWVLSMVLMAAEHTHEDGLCYAGGFSIKDMWYLPDSRSVEIRAPTQLITQEGYVEDEAFIGSVIDKWFTYQGSDSILHYPMFVEDLIMKIDNLDTAGDEFISVKKRSLIFLHPASKSACERLKIIDALMVHYHKLLHADAKAFQNALCGLNFSWIDKVSDADAAPEMRRRYYHRFWDGRAGKYSTKAYAEDYFGRLDLTRCLITHTDSQVTEKQVDAAIFHEQLKSCGEHEQLESCGKGEGLKRCGEHKQLESCGRDEELKRTARGSRP